MFTIYHLSIATEKNHVLNKPCEPVNGSIEANHSQNRKHLEKSLNFNNNQPCRWHIHIKYIYICKVQNGNKSNLCRILGNKQLFGIINNVLTIQKHMHVRSHMHICARKRLLQNGCVSNKKCGCHQLEIVTAYLANQVAAGQTFCCVCCCCCCYGFLVFFCRVIKIKFRSAK